MAKQSSNLRNQSRIAIWLAPAPETSHPCSSAIRELAQRHGGPAFEPHVTIACEALPESAALDRVLEELASPTGPVVLEPEGIHAEESFTKSLFIRYHPTDGLLALRRRVLELAGVESSATESGFDPHLSLMYSTLPLEERRHIASTFDPALLRSGPHRFDRLQTISVPGPVQSALDVESWELIDEKPLEKIAG